MRAKHLGLKHRHNCKTPFTFHCTADKRWSLRYIVS